MASFAPTTIIALISTTIFILAFLAIATLAYLKNRLPLVHYSPTPSSCDRSQPFYQYDPNPKYTPTPSQARMSLLVVSPSCPVMVPLHSNSKRGVQMIQVMITPPSPVKRAITTVNSV